ncbi:MAG TPA: PDZ domain-containing protein, partial [Methylomirabilota bacterium]|nr:PDZ domain-containing protein [Methylomirabilota bacterium]
LPQMAPMEAIEGKSDKPREPLPPISALDKIIVAFAGPLFSFLLAVAFAVVVWVVGRPVTESETTTVVGHVDKGSPAERAGLRPGDRILEIDGHPVTKWGGMGSSVSWRIIRSEGEVVSLKIERGGQILTLEAQPVKQKVKPWQRASLRQLLMEPSHTPVVGAVVPGSPAERAGLRRGDEITEVNGQPLYHPAGLGDYIEAHGARPLVLKGRRADQSLAVSLTPEVPQGATNDLPRAGIQWDAGGGKPTLARPGVGEQIQASVDAMLSTFGALFSPKSDIKAQHLSGPVKIWNIYYVLFKSEQGWRLAIWFSVIMNVNLALLNLLPIPVLDGGHITLAIVEGVIRRPVNARLLGILQTSCAVLLIGYMVYIAFYDVQELPWRRAKEPSPVEMKFAPGAPPGAVPAK